MTIWRKTKRRHASEHPTLPGLIQSQPTSSSSRRLATPHEHALGIAQNRLTIGVIVFALAYLVIAGRLGFLMLMSEAPDLPMARHEVNETVASRADITDRNGMLLATSLPTISLCADAKKILDPNVAVKQLVSVLPDLDIKKLSDDLHNGKHCAVVKRHLTPRQTYEVNRLGIAGLEFRPDERRLYPASNIVAHLVGYTDIDNNGLAGIEKKMDQRLQQDPAPLALSIDLRLQSIMHSELLNAMTEFRAEGAAGLIMDINTGELLSMVSLPDFDPQHPGQGADDDRFNRDTLGVYEMGSTFKIFNTAMALDSGLIHVNSTFDTIHPIVIGHQTIKDYHPENRAMNVAEILTHSSNIGSARMAEKLGSARQRAFLSRLGLTEKLSLEIPEIGAPLLPTARDWGDTTTMTVAFGHGIAVNSVQVVGAVASIVNDGIAVHPTLLHKTTPPAPVAEEDRVVSPHTSALMRGLMRLVVTRGTAKAAEVAGYIMGGKTGTADKLGANHKYMTNARLSSFIGVFPLNAPKYIVFAMLDDPKGNAKTYGFATGGWVAAPVVNHVAAQMGPLMNLQPMSPELQASTEQQILKPLGNLTVDGKPIEEGSPYAASESDSVE